MGGNWISDIQKMSSRANRFLSLALLVFHIFCYIEQGAIGIVPWTVFSTAMFVADMLLALPLVCEEKRLWIWMRIAQLILYAFPFNLENYPVAFALNSAVLLLLLLELVFWFGHGDIYARTVTLILGIIPAAAVLVINMLVSADTHLAFGRAGILACVGGICAILSNIAFDEINKSKQRLLEQKRLANNTKETNEELRKHQEKVKKANAELSVQKIKLEAAYDRIHFANREMALQNEILKAITSVIEVEKLLSIVTKSLKGELGLDCCAIFLYRDAASNEETICMMDSVFSAKMQEIVKSRILDGDIEEYLGYRKGYIDNHVSVGEYKFLDGHSFGSLLIFPMVRDNSVIGGLLAVHAQFGFFRDNGAFFDTIMTQFMIVLENAALYAKMQRMAICDGLTGIYNRGHLNTEIEQFIREAKEQKTSLSVALFDIDYFKRVNDTYGHLFGDLVIKTIAGFAKDAAKKYNGFAARYGGEEFVLVFPKKSVEECCKVVDELRSNIHGMRLEYNGMLVSVDVSVGVTGYPQCCESASVLLEHADWAMYYSKEHGRGRVTVDSEVVRGQLGLDREKSGRMR